MDIKAASAHDRLEIAYGLMDGALDIIARKGGGTLQWWVDDPTAGDDVTATAAGLIRMRDLCELRRTLPLARFSEDEALELRSFEVGVDEHEWLALNNRAFHWHPDQGGWTLATLQQRESESWFDPEGFLILERLGRMIGFCWTKIHELEDPPLGEIYVIGVDPDFQGSGWGRSLVLAGLDWLTRRGVTVGMLWVESSNTSALRLYESLGFTTHRRRRAYQREVPARNDQTP